MFVGGLIALLFIYEDEVKAAVVKELNKHLKTEVKVNPENIKLTVVKTFPDCSIEFKNVLMLEALPIKQRDSLLFAEQLNLYFNIQNLWNKKYDIERIKIKNAVAKLQQLKNGKNNYTFWKSSANTGSSGNVAFNLNLISVENCRLHYKDIPNSFKTEVFIKNLEFAGHFKESQFDLNTTAQAQIQYITHKKTTFLKNKNLNFVFDLDVNENSYTFKKTALNLNQLALELNGGFTYDKTIQKLNLNFNAPNLDIASVLSILPEDLKNNINDYESTGNFYAQGNIKYADKNNYSIVSSFGIKNAKITYKPQQTEAHNVNAEGNLQWSNSSSVLDIKNISLNLNEDEIAGKFLVKDFSKPYLQVVAQAKVHLENVIRFYPIDTLTLLKGKLTLNSEIEGTLKELKNETFSAKVKLKMNAAVSALQAQFKGDEKIYSVENCSLIAQNREVEVHDLMLKRGNSDIKVNGKIPELFNYLFDKNSPLIIQGDLVSGQIFMEDFIVPSQPSSKGKEQNAGPLIPKNVQLKLNAEISKFNFGKFEAKNISGDIEIKNQKAIVNEMKLQTMQGEAEIQIFADNSKNKLDVVLQSNLKNINITELFFQMENFGQTTLQDKNLKGVASASIDFSGTWNNNLEADYKSIKSICNLEILRGELINFSPLLSLSKFVDVQDLQHIRFSDLQSSVQINNGVISIAKTSIKNSALNIDVFGTHNFDGRIDYHFQLLISELLANKRKRKNDDEFGLVENDKENRRSAFITMTGTLDNPIFKYDRKSLREKVKTDIKAEKQNVSELLKEEFKVFKNDPLENNKFELEKPNNSSSNKKEEEDEDF